MRSVSARGSGVGGRRREGASYARLDRMMLSCHRLMDVASENWISVNGCQLVCMEGTLWHPSGDTWRVLLTRSPHHHATSTRLNTKYWNIHYISISGRSSLASLHSGHSGQFAVITPEWPRPPLHNEIRCWQIWNMFSISGDPRRPANEVYGSPVSGQQQLTTRHGRLVALYSR